MQLARSIRIKHEISLNLTIGPAIRRLQKQTQTSRYVNTPANDQR